MAVESFSDIDPTARYYVYALLCHDPAGGPGYIKIGYSKNVFSRITSLRTNCPIPAQQLAIIRTQDIEPSVRSVERDLHRQFRSRKVSGEWFRFDFSNPDDRAEFNDGCKLVFKINKTKMRDKWWTKLPISAIDEDAKRRKDKYLKSGKALKRRIDGARKTEQYRKAAWKELRTYGT